MSVPATKHISTTDIQVFTKPNAESKLPVKGADWFPLRYSLTFILAKKNSGKTVLVDNILRHCAGPRTKFIFIVSTIDRDPTWNQIVQHWENAGNSVETHSDLVNADGENVIEEFITQMQNQTPTSTNPTDRQQSMGSGAQPIGPALQKRVIGVENRRIIRAQHTSPVVDVSPGSPQQLPAVQRIAIDSAMQAGGAKKKMISVTYPEYFIVCDDLGDSMRSKAVTQLLKTHRHFKTSVILSAQNIADLVPASIRQLDYTLVFGRVPDEKMEDLRKNLLLEIDPIEFIKIYHDATRADHQFLYIGRSADGDQYRKGFSRLYVLPDNIPRTADD